MFRTLAAAVIAASLIAGPALAQTPASTGNAPVTTSQPAAKADAVKPAVKLVKKTRHHTVKMVKHVKHVKHHFKHVKQVKHPAKSKTAG
jgi:hypothetical protein